MFIDKRLSFPFPFVIPPPSLRGNDILSFIHKLTKTKSPSHIPTFFYIKREHRDIINSWNCRSLLNSNSNLPPTHVKSMLSSSQPHMQSRNTACQSDVLERSRLLHQRHIQFPADGPQSYPSPPQIVSGEEKGRKRGKLRKRRTYGIKRTKVTLDTTNLVFEDFVIEPCFELSLSLGSCRDFAGFLAAAEDYKVFFGGEGCGV